MNMGGCNFLSQISINSHTSFAHKGTHEKCISIKLDTNTLYRIQNRTYHIIFINFQELIREGEPIEVIFVSFDQCPEDMMAYMRECHGDWLAVQHGTVLARYPQ